MPNGQPSPKKIVVFSLNRENYKKKLSLRGEKKCLQMRESPFFFKGGSTSFTPSSSIPDLSPSTLQFSLIKKRKFCGRRRKKNEPPSRKIYKKKEEEKHFSPLPDTRRERNSTSSCLYPFCGCVCGVSLHPKSQRYIICVVFYYCLASPVCAHR